MTTPPYSPTPTTTLFTLCLLLLLTTLPTKINSQVPTSKTFTFTLNKPQLVSNKAEYGATYLDVPYTSQITTSPFALCFYNTTPNAYVLSMRTSAGSPARFVWEANRNRPVGEGSTLSLGRDGDLVLARSDGRVAWRSGTAGKGVAGIELTPGGNLVLHDSTGRGVVWQSFDRPADALLVGMSLDGPKRLVSRRSEADGSGGPYSLVMEEEGLVAYWNYDGKNNSKRLRYADWRGLTSGNKVTLAVDSTNSSSYDLVFEIESPSEGHRKYIIRSFTYDPTYSFLRIASNGNIFVFTYNNRSSTWEQTFSYFPDHHIRECALPSRCGRFGLCDNGRCIGCPIPRNGLLPWSEKCAPPSLGRRCGGARGKVGYYRIDGAEHFLTLLTSGEAPMSASECGDRCSDEGCECKGFVYDEETRVCLRVPVLATLIREGNSTRTSVYVKYSI